MPPNFHFLRALTSATFLKTGCTFRHLKMVSSLAQITSPKKLYHTPSNVGESSSKELTTKDDMVMNKLESATTVEDVLKLLQRHSPVMNYQHHLKALSSLFDLHKTSSFSLSKEEITKKREFRMLCNTVLEQSKQMNLTSQINSLKCLAYFEVPANTRIVQCLLNLISKQVNDLGLRQIIYLDFLIGLFKDIPLVTALKIALPIVFEVKLPKELDETNLTLISDCLHYASTRSISNSSFDLLVSNLTAHQGDIPVKSAVSILRSLCNRNESNDTHIVLLYRILDLLVDSIYELSHNEVIILLNKIVQKGVSYDYFIHTMFIDACLSRIIDSNYDLKGRLKLVKKLRKLNYSSLPLLKNICELIDQNPNFLPTTSIGDAMIVLSALANDVYKPKNWDTVQNSLLNKFMEHLKYNELPWLFICHWFFMLDVWPHEILDKVLSADFLHHFLNRENSQRDYRTLLHVYQAIMTLYPGVYPGPLPPPDVIERALSFVEPIFEHPLLPALSKGLGGPQYVNSAIFTEYGHNIDHVIVLRKDGHVVASNKDPDNLSKEIRYLQDIEVPPEAVIIGVMAIWPRECNMNSGNIRGRMVLFMRTLEAMGIMVVPVIISRWNSLLEHERIPWLMQQIKLKASENEVMLQQ